MLERLKTLSTDDKARPVFKRPSIGRENVRQFIEGMCRRGGEAREAVWSSFGRIIEHSDATEDALFLISKDPDGITLCSSLDRDRCVAIARRHLTSTFARAAIKHWFGNACLTDDERKEIVVLAESTLATDADGVFDLGWDSLITMFFETLLDRVGGTTWVPANGAISSIQQLDALRVARMTLDQRVRYLMQVASHNGRSYPAHRANDLLNGGLGDRTNFIDALIERIAATPADVRATRTNWHGLALLAEKSGRLDGVKALVDLFDGHEHRDFVGIEEMLKMVGALMDHPALATKAAEGLARRAAALAAP
jgi:hypothetical protein